MSRPMWYMMAVFLLLIVSEDAAFAYIDPGTGGMLYQVLVLIFGAIAAYFVFLKRYIKGLFTRTQKSDEEDR